ncbi:GH39 family glycosyl hydrolase [Maribellus maritimus]|uniref:GH39 family glycosyl hydrolase n=1 Tax=Maribellus maritimus TaxID=2870838 RepID=UPI001EE9D6EB|nr:hypothetical protein [Maribellus maritimus]MCG6189945.1 hypothetical protein [Maribellus maritimus]
MKKLSLVIANLLFTLSFISGQPNYFTINTQKIVGKNTDFWKAAGSDHLFYHALQPSGQILLNRMENKNSHVYMRSHHTFTQDLAHGVIRGQNVYSEDRNGKSLYDFSNVNKVFAAYVERGLKPIVEYDYIPKELEIDEKNISSGNDEGMTMRNTGPRDWQKWSDLMKAATQNFINVFGTEEVRTWYFEVWNEPDGWPVDQMDVFFKMYDIFVDAVTSVDPELKVGGPACYHEFFLRPFLEHVTRGTNFVSGEKGTKIDFISYHIYGLSGSWLNNEPHIQPQVQRFSQSVLWLQRMISKYPELNNVEFHLNEWGMSSNYYRTVADYPDLRYRNNEESALFLVKLVNSLYQIEDNYNFPTSLLLYWGFCGEADAESYFLGQRELTTGEDIPKPIQTGFEMLAKLKSNRIEVIRSKKDNQFGIIATGKGKETISFIAYNYEEDENPPGVNDEMHITLNGLEPNTRYNIIETALDKENNNTYSAWMKAGSPKKNAGDNLSAIKNAGELNPTNKNKFTTDKNGVVLLELPLKSHSMKLIEINKTK